MKMSLQEYNFKVEVVFASSGEHYTDYFTLEQAEYMRWWLSFGIKSNGFKAIFVESASGDRWQWNKSDGWIKY